MTPEQSRQFNRTQLMQVLAELADRARETDEPALACILYTTVGSMAEGSDHILALILANYIAASAQNEQK